MNWNEHIWIREYTWAHSLKIPHSNLLSVWDVDTTTTVLHRSITHCRWVYEWRELWQRIKDCERISFWPQSFHDPYGLYASKWCVFATSYEPGDLSISMPVQQKRWISLMPQMWPTWYDSWTFTALAAIIAKESSSNRVKWELDSAIARPGINETLC